VGDLDMRMCRHLRDAGQFSAGRRPDTYGDIAAPRQVAAEEKLITTPLITGGTVASATGRGEADVLIDGETIAAVLAPGSQLLGTDVAASVDTVIDASGKYVIPGG